MAGSWRRTWHGPAGLIILGLAVWASLAGVAWVRTWFYQFAWWSYILVVDAAVQWRAGNSLLVDRPRAFLVMALASATFWFGWEMVNLRVANWHYVGIPRDIWQRWLGAFVAYATVLPGLLGTYELLTVLGLRWWSRVRPLGPGTGWYGWFLALGLSMFALPLAWPKLFFPLIWLALIFVLEPLNHRLGLPSLMRYWQAGDLSPLLRLLFAGLICGAAWESWNFLAEARWVYTIPYLNELRIFTMPLAGYGGFPPFAVECFVFMSALGALRGGKGWQPADHNQATMAQPPGWVMWLVILAVVAFDVLALMLIDKYLVKGWV